MCIRDRVKILERAETIGDCPLRPERLWENVTRSILDRVTLCYVRFECFHSYETPELLMAQKSATCKIGPSDLVPLEKTPSALRDGLQSPPVSSPSVLARAPAWAIG